MLSKRNKSGTRKLEKEASINPPRRSERLKSYSTLQTVAEPVKQPAGRVRRSSVKSVDSALSVKSNGMSRSVSSLVVDVEPVKQTKKETVYENNSVEQVRKSSVKLMDSALSVKSSGTSKSVLSSVVDGDDVDTMIHRLRRRKDVKLPPNRQLEDVVSFGKRQPTTRKGRSDNGNKREENVAALEVSSIPGNKRNDRRKSVAAFEVSVVCGNKRNDRRKSVAEFEVPVDSGNGRNNQCPNCEKKDLNVIVE